MTTVTFDKPTFDIEAASAVEAFESTVAYAENNYLGSDYVGHPELNLYETTAQGDINITRFKSVSELGETNKVKAFTQLAPGDSKGSRHCIDLEFSNAGNTMKFYNLRHANPIQGPIFTNTVETLITHPEHGDQVLPPGCYFVSYQTLHAEELRRLAD